MVLDVVADLGQTGGRRSSLHLVGRPKDSYFTFRPRITRESEFSQPIGVSMTAASPSLSADRSSLASRSSAADTHQIPTLEEVLTADADRFVARYTDVAAINLACAVGLPKAEDLDIPKCLRSLSAMAQWIEKRTAGSWHIYDQDPKLFEHSKNLFRVIIMLRFLHVQFGVHYNPLRIEYREDN